MNALGKSNLNYALISLFNNRTSNYGNELWRFCVCISMKISMNFHIPIWLLPPTASFGSNKTKYTTQSNIASWVFCIQKGLINTSEERGHFILPGFVLCRRHESGPGNEMKQSIANNVERFRKKTCAISETLSLYILRSIVVVLKRDNIFYAISYRRYFDNNF